MKKGQAVVHSEAAAQISKQLRVSDDDDTKLQDELKKIREEAAAKPLWVGPPLPQLARLETTPINSRSVSLDKLDVSSKKAVSCTAPKHSDSLFYYFMQADIPGMDVGSEHVKTPNECCTKCIENPKCEAWTHVDGTCWLKSSANKVLDGKAGLTSALVSLRTIKIFGISSNIKKLCKI